MIQTNVTQLDCPEFRQNQIMLPQQPQQMSVYNLSNTYPVTLDGQHLHQLQNNLSEQTFARYKQICDAYFSQLLHQSRNNLSEQIFTRHKQICDAYFSQLLHQSRDNLSERTLDGQTYSKHVHQSYTQQSPPIYQGHLQQSPLIYQGYPQPSPPIYQGHPQQSPLIYQGYPQPSPPIYQGHPQQSPLIYQGYPQPSPPIYQGHPQQSPLIYQGYPHQSPLIYQGYPHQSPLIYQGYLQQSPPIYQGYPQQSTSGTYSMDQNGEPDVFPLSPQPCHTVMPAVNLVNQSPPIYQGYPQQSPSYPQQLQISDQNGEPDVFPLSPQPCHIVMPAVNLVNSQTTFTDKPSNLRNNYQTLTKTASTKKRDPHTFELILIKDKKSIIPRTRKTVNLVRFEDYSAIGIRRSIEEVYPQQLKNEDWGFFKCKTIKRKSADVRGSHKLVATNEPQNVDEVNT
ncbi:unnamed protein product [Rhizophagus irregularis]|nr:unnamed protein product [Rhizophagus irregularis]CAB5359548.1 unnamed protein product [Rhizophagus irregularis]